MEGVPSIEKGWQASTISGRLCLGLFTLDNRKFEVQRICTVESRGGQCALS